MNSKKNKEKERRRARKLAEEAWEAAEDQNLDLAEKIIRRAVATQMENPVLWNDQGMLLALRGTDEEAAESFRSAISLAPNYAEPFAHLAAMRARQGYPQEAVRLMEQAVQHAPATAHYAERLKAYQTLIDCTHETTPEPVAIEMPAASPAEVAKAALPFAGLDWKEWGKRLTEEGCVRIPALLDPSTCAALSALFDDDTLFSQTVVMNRDEFGRGVYRYFKAPIPALVDKLRRAFYPHVAEIANAWQKLLNEEDRFPGDWEDLRSQCAKVGQTTPTPILLKYEAGGFNALHRDLRGSLFFPIQMAIVLSPIMQMSGTEGFRGGEFLLGDVPDGKHARRREIPAGLGDAILFCTRDRLVCVGGAYGLQPVKHGVQPITEGLRFVLGVPFHEYR